MTNSSKTFRNRILNFSLIEILFDKWNLIIIIVNFLFCSIKIYKRIYLEETFCKLKYKAHKIQIKLCNKHFKAISLGYYLQYFLSIISNDCWLLDIYKSAKIRKRFSLRLGHDINPCLLEMNYKNLDGLHFLIEQFLLFFQFRWWANVKSTKVKYLISKEHFWLSFNIHFLFCGSGSEIILNWQLK
jgi:hypothetical protein